MDIHTATEQAYKNGYAKGYADALGGWISVKDRLPDEGVTVIVALKIGDRIVSDTDRLYCGRWFCYGRMNREGYVTHWMPFPEPPKGNKTDFLPLRKM